MDLRSEIIKDFNDHLEFLNGQKVTTNVRLHRKRAGIIGSLMFLADLAEKNGFPNLSVTLITQAKYARTHQRGVEQQFNENWLHNMRDVKKMKSTFLCDMSAGYNAARDEYAKKYKIVPLKMPVNMCALNPNVSKAINKLMEKLVSLD